MLFDLNRDLNDCCNSDFSVNRTQVEALQVELQFDIKRPLFG